MMKGWIPAIIKNSAAFGELTTIGFGVMLALCLRMFAYEPFNIPSGSMIPTLEVGDFVLVSKYSYGYSRFSLIFSPNLFEGRVFSTPPERGDVAVFRNPTQPDIDYIKRVIGLPGDRIQMRDGRLYINGVRVERTQIEPYSFRLSDGRVRELPQYMETLPNGKSYKIIEGLGDRGGLDNTMEYLVPAGSYFMMGDNRDNSTDSRVTSKVGAVPLDHFIGPATSVVMGFEDHTHWYNPISWFTGFKTERAFNSIH